MTCKTQSKWYTQAKHTNNLLTSKNICVQPTTVQCWHNFSRYLQSCSITDTRVKGGSADQLLTLVFITDFYWAKELLSVRMFNTITMLSTTPCCNMFLIWNSKYCKCWQFLSSQMFSKTTRCKCAESQMFSTTLLPSSSSYLQKGAGSDKMEIDAFCLNLPLFHLLSYLETFLSICTVLVSSSKTVDQIVRTDEVWHNLI